MRFLAVLNNLETCPGFPEQEVPSLEDELNEIGLTMDDWDAFLDVMMGEDEQQKKRWNCWMKNRIMQCERCPECSGSDPFS